MLRRKNNLGEEFMTGQKVLPIVFSVDENFILPLSVVIKSLKKNCKNNCVIYVFFERLTEEGKEKILAFNDKKTEIRLFCVEEYIRDHKLYQQFTFTKAMYFRFFVPKFCSEHEKVLYLDCDILVKNDFSLLFDLDMQGKCIAGVHDEGTKENSYINSGVLLFDVKKCNEFCFTEKCLKYVDEHAELYWPDQDAINAVCRGYIYYLDIGYNVQSVMLCAKAAKKTPVKRLKTICNMAKINKKDVVFIHYIGGGKPWNDRAVYIWGIPIPIPLVRLWWKEASRLPKNYFKDEKQFKPKFEINFKRVLRKILGEKSYNKLKNFFKRK